MSNLDKVLLKEFERYERDKQTYKEQIKALPVGYLSRKNIKGKIYFYLQHREGDKVVSKYIPTDDVDMLQKLLETRKNFERKIKEIEADQRKICKVVGRLIT